MFKISLAFLLMFTLGQLSHASDLKEIDHNKRASLGNKQTALYLSSKELENKKLQSKKLQAIPKENTLSNLCPIKNEMLNQNLVSDLKLRKDAIKKKEGAFEKIKSAFNYVNSKKYTIHTPFIKPLNKEIAILSPVEPEEHSPLVAKFFKKNLKPYINEKRSLDRLGSIKDLLDKLKEKDDHNYDIPILTKYYGGAQVVNEQGEEEGILLLGKAKGKPLKKIQDNLSILKFTEIDTIYNAIGKQMGGLDALICSNMKVENNGLLKVLHHPDSHSDNFFYDYNDGKLYWIDLAGIKYSFVDKESPIRGKRLGHSFEGYGFLKPLIDNIKSNLLITTDRKIDGAVAHSIKCHLQAITSFFAGYLSQMDKSKDGDVINFRKGVLNDYKDIVNTKIKTPINKKIQSIFKEYEFGADISEHTRLAFELNDFLIEVEKVIPVKILD
jgi:hypothetical protein